VLHHRNNVERFSKERLKWSADVPNTFYVFSIVDPKGFKKSSNSDKRSSSASSSSTASKKKQPTGSPTKRKQSNDVDTKKEEESSSNKKRQKTSAKKSNSKKKEEEEEEEEEEEDDKEVVEKEEKKPLKEEEEEEMLLVKFGRTQHKDAMKRYSSTELNDYKMELLLELRGRLETMTKIENLWRDEAKRLGLFKRFSVGSFHGATEVVLVTRSMLERLLNLTRKMFDEDKDKFETWLRDHEEKKRLVLQEKREGEGEKVGSRGKGKRKRKPAIQEEDSEGVKTRKQIDPLLEWRRCHNRCHCHRHSQRLLAQHCNK